MESMLHWKRFLIQSRLAISGRPPAMIISANRFSPGLVKNRGWNGSIPDYNTTVNGPIGLSGWLKIILPLFLSAIFGLSPRPAGLVDALAAMAAEQPEQEKIETVLGHEPWRVDAVEKLALAKMQAGDSAGVIHILGRAGRDGILSTEGSRLLAGAYEEAGLPRQALAAYLAVLRLAPDERENYLAVSRLEMNLGEFEAALDTLDNMLERYPQDAEGMYRLGLVEFALTFDSGVVTIKQAAKLNPLYQKKLKILEAAEKQSGRSTVPAHRLLLRGRALGAVGEWSMAQSLFEEVVALDPAYAEGWAYLGEARQQTGAGDGQAQLKKAAELNAGSQTVRGLTALFHRRRGEFEQAVRLISLAALDEPELASWQIEWANTLAEKGDLKEALIHYRKALDLESNDLDNLYLLASFSLHFDMELRETGLPAARDGAARQTRDPRWQDLLGSIFWRLGDEDLAERAYRKALEIDSGHAAAHLHLGQYYLDNGEIEPAFAHILAAAEQNEDKTVSDMAERLLARYFNLEGTPESTP